MPVFRPMKAAGESPEFEAQGPRHFYLLSPFLSVQYPFFIAIPGAFMLLLDMRGSMPL